METNVTTSSSQQLVSLIYTYHECNETKTEGRNLRSHLQNMHNMSVSTLRRGQRFYDNSEYAFVKINGNVKHGNIQERFACPSYVNHFRTMDDYKKHLQTHIILSSDDNTTHNSKHQRKNFGVVEK